MEQRKQARGWHQQFLGFRARINCESMPARISRLLEAHEILLKEARTMARQAAEAGDDGTNDLLVSEVIRANELQVWFLAEHVVDAPVVRADEARAASPGR